jgi:hypothetical protein
MTIENTSSSGQPGNRPGAGAVELGEMLSAMTGDAAYSMAAERGEHPLAVFRGYKPASAIDLPVAMLPGYRAALAAMGAGSTLFRTDVGGWVVLPAPSPDNMGERHLVQSRNTFAARDPGPAQQGWAILANPVPPRRR